MFHNYDVCKPLSTQTFCAVFVILCNTVVLVVNVLLQFDVFFSYVLHIVDMKVIDGPNIGHIRSAQRSTKFTLF